MKPTYIVQDIETIPETEIVDMWEPSEKDKERYPDRPPFPPIWCHKVISIGLLALDREFKPLKGGCSAGGCSGDNSEADMIKAWSNTVSGRRWGMSHALKMVDYNGQGFDVPVLQTRAFRYGIQLPWYFGKLPDNRGEITKWSKEYRDKWNGDHLDLQSIWTNKGMFRYPHLANLARLMGLPGKGGFDGADVHRAYKDGEFERIDNYCMEDVFQTALILIRFKHLSGEINLDGYKEACASMLKFIEDDGSHADFLSKVDKAALFLEED